MRIKFRVCLSASNNIPQNLFDGTQTRSVCGDLTLRLNTIAMSVSICTLYLNHRSDDEKETASIHKFKCVTVIVIAHAILYRSRNSETFNKKHRTSKVFPYSSASG